MHISCFTALRLQSDKRFVFVLLGLACYRTGLHVFDAATLHAARGVSI
jgi:hypothetical protein